MLNLLVGVFTASGSPRLSCCDPLFSNLFSGGVGLNADVAVGFNPAQHLTGPQHHRRWHASEPSGFDAIAPISAAVHDPMQEAQG